MDVWMFAAAAGAGFVAQRLKNLRMRNHNSSDLSSDKLHCIRPDPSRNLQFEEEVCEQREHAYHDASTSGIEGENLIQLDNFGCLGMVSESNSLAGLFKIEDVEDIISDSVSQPSIRFSNGYRRNRSGIGSRLTNSKFIKPRNSLESCLMAQLYKEPSQIEEYTYSTHPSQKPIILPFLDGSSESSRMRDFMQSKDTHSQENKTVICVPRLPSVVAVDLEMDTTAKTGKGKFFVGGNTSKVIDGNQSNAQGSLNGILLFFLGLTMGISYSLSGHEREIGKLRNSLKQSESLVQDLQEELEMKDALTVKELSVEDYESSVHKDSCFDDDMQILSLEQNDGNNDQSTKAESLRKIEAELEAELDRLESNMNSSGLEGKLSDVAELDPDFVPCIIEGELKVDLFVMETEETDAEKEENSSNISTPHCAHYPVSPRELSLRLHEVIQSRLEERVKELEIALEHTERKIKSMEVPGHKTGHESPDATDKPVVINEAYDAFAKVSESDEEQSNREIFHPQRDDPENGWLNRCTKQLYLASNERLETSFCRVDEDDVDNTVLNDVVCSSRDGSEDGEESEMERLLIRQIVEKARQGSPALLKAQRAFLSIHES